MRKNKKALTYIIVILGALVLYCLMNHTEGFATPIIHTSPPWHFITPEEAKKNRDLILARMRAEYEERVKHLTPEERARRLEQLKLQEEQRKRQVEAEIKKHHKL